MSKIFFITLFLIFLRTLALQSQDIPKLRDDIKNNKPLAVTGGVNANTSAVAAIGTELKRDPYFWQLNANLNFNFFGVINAPFSATFTKENKTFNQPAFNQYGISPQYKYVTVHLGYRNMSFSNYSFSGLTFFGTGIEVTPEDSPVKVCAMYGRFNKAVFFTDLSGIEEENVVIEPPSYERRGYGTKITLGKEKNIVDLIFFKAKDIPNTLLDTIGNLKPEENLIMGFNTKNKITDKLTLNIEYTNSIYTFDSRLPDVEYQTYTYVNNMSFLFSPKISTQIKNAYVGKLDYSIGKTNVGFSYRRVDPGYKSMGMYGIVSDVEEYTTNISSQFLENKLNLSGSIGGQRDNLDKVNMQTMKRFIGSVNSSYSPKDNLNFSVSYSNFSSQLLPTRISFADSIKYIQVTENFVVTTNYSIKEDDISHNFVFVNNFQTANTTNRSFTDTIASGTKIYSGNLNYQLSIKERKIGVSLSANYSSFKSDMGKTTTFGPTLGVSKPFFNDKLKSSLNYSFLISKSIESNGEPINNVSLNCNYKITKKQSLRFNFRYLLKSGLEINHIHKFQANLMYSFTF